MKHITEIEALQECSKMWHWLAENPDARKSSYFIGKAFVLHACYLCEYVKTKGRIKDKCLGEGDYLDCKNHCPLIGFWPEDDGAEDTYPCDYRDSPYRIWADMALTNPLRGKYALMIAEAADKVLEQVEANKPVQPVGK